jgi:hypothetical protein
MVIFILIIFPLKLNHFAPTVKGRMMEDGRQTTEKKLALKRCDIRRLSSGVMFFYASLRAAMMFILDARKAGSTPPAKPMISENDRDLITMPGVRAKLKASSEKV